MTDTLTIDIVSDVVCPWCIIGYRQLERAIGAIGSKAEVSIRWHPFELAPGMPPEGMNIADYVRERYGATPEQGSANRARIAEIGQSLGIDFRYSAESRMYNTKRAHALLAWAGETGGQTMLKLALFNAFFTEQKNLHEAAVLLDAVEAAGLDRKAAREALDDPRHAETVDAEIAHWQNENITGVPAFIVNSTYMIPGAQDTDTWARVLDRVLEKQRALA
jgi:predicted DsbA family dithiol-disulfide isomerase